MCSLQLSLVKTISRLLPLVPVTGLFIKISFYDGTKKVPLEVDYFISSWIQASLYLEFHRRSRHPSHIDLFPLFHVLGEDRTQTDLETLREPK